MFFLATLIYLLLSSTSSIRANSEFTITKNITYQFDNSGDAQVIQDIKLFNNYSVIYAKEYQLIIHDQNISNLSATDKLGNILRESTTKDNSTTIFIEFNQPSINTQKSTDFQIKYTVSNLAKNQGNIWKINFPKHTNNQDDQIEIDVLVPSSWGKLAYSSIPLTSLIDSNFQTIHIPKQQATYTVSLTFGDTQLFDFNLSYFLENNDSKTKNFQIPLPPDSDTQTVNYINIKPLPLNIIVDPDGNYLAQYQLSPNQKTNISSTGQVKVHTSNSKFPFPKPQSFHLQESQFWPVTNPTITSHAKSLKTAKKIYDFVIQSLEYNPSQIENATRKSPLTSLVQPQNSLCTDFTDLFISIARAASIPSREIQGYLYSQDSLFQSLKIQSDILHAWPQFWNQDRWQQIDPTWQKTTKGDDYYNSIDLNRVILVFHGQDSQNPPPPDSYNQDNQQRTVVITPTNIPIDSQIMSPNISLKKTILSIHNPNNQSLTNISIKNEIFSIEKIIDIIPPFSYVQIELPEIKNPISLFPKNKQISLDLVYDQGQAKQLIENPHQKTYMVASILFLVLLSTTGIILIKHK